jgi:NNP family nitrate/nitrite transporter-like MFS transporter
MINFEYPGAWRALSAATLAFAANFSVWTLYAVIGLELRETLDLNATQLGLFFSAPVLTGALGRIPAGWLSEKFNPKSVYIWQMLLSTPPLFLLPYVDSLMAYIWLGLWIGISGTSFTIGIRYVTDWFESKRQGTAMGIFGAGNTGSAITLMLAPFIVEHWGWNSIGPIYGIGLLLVAFVFMLVAPSRNFTTSTAPGQLSLKQALKQGQIWRFGLYYYFVFGSFLALILWLPQYYASAYELNYTQAMAFTLFFVATSSMVRALGGWFADRYGGRSVNWTVFWVCIVCLFFLCYPPTTMTIHGVNQDVQFSIEINVWVFSGLIFIIGIAQGFGRASVYKTIHDYYPQQMGLVGGIVAAIGALGGCTLPIAFGIAVDLLGFYSACFMVLYAVLALCMMVMFFALKEDRFQKRILEATKDNFLELD